VPLPKTIARVNRAVTNHITRPLAGHVPGFGVVTHRGRRSGRTYRTPVNVFSRPGGYTIVLTYGRGDWVQNVEAAGFAEVLVRGRPHLVVNPRIQARDPDELPLPVRVILGLIHADEVLVVDGEQPPTPPPTPQAPPR